MPSRDEYRAFADRCVEQVAKTIQEQDFEAYERFFDMDDEFTRADFEDAIREQDEDGLGALISHEFMGSLQGDPEFPGSTRFVYRGKFSAREGLVILSVHERDGALYLNEHVYWY